ncbi:DUF7059 domain-containing protein [Neomicrococcus aestuarii]|uniref:Uncharacterized protein n=1 Tax=Neomicrococcus aestuarii TaxID=556325 RepID=A0A1L2ZQV9_9MICC|nr:methyltransferase [Neomicrococcus aestuarii]APF41392.1 hypothetical protein BHE16_10765 [Neomicrococcus aestuarii]
MTFSSSASPEFAAVPDAPASGDVVLLDALAAELERARFDYDGIEAFLGREEFAALDRDQTVPARRVIAREFQNPTPNPLAVFLSLFLLGDEVNAALVGDAFPTLGVEGLEELRLIEWTDFGVRSTVDLRPYASDTTEIWVASDLGSSQSSGALRTDYVLGIGQASLTLARFVNREPVQHALDLGTGCGIQTFHLLEHSERVTATDISDRALAYTRFNVLLNRRTWGLEPRDLKRGGRLHLVKGDMLKPVAGERFDLVVTNPPFVITPRVPGRDVYTYRDGGRPGDRLVGELIRDVPTVLAPHGNVYMLANWEISGEGEDLSQMDWRERPQEWVAAARSAGHDLDAWFIQRDQANGYEYAETWLRDAAEARDPQLYADRYGQYLDDFAVRSVAGVGFGLVWLRARGGAVDRFEEVLHPVEEPIGPAFAAAVERADQAAQWDVTHALQDQFFAIPEDVTEERHQRPGSEHPSVILLRQGSGFRRSTILTSEAAGFVSACDGELSAGVLAQAIATLSPDIAEEDEAAFIDNLLAQIEHLFLMGFLHVTHG